MARSSSLFWTLGAAAGVGLLLTLDSDQGQGVSAPARPRRLPLPPPEKADPAAPAPVPRVQRDPGIGTGAKIPTTAAPPEGANLPPPEDVSALPPPPSDLRLKELAEQYKASVERWQSHMRDEIEGMGLGEEEYKSAMDAIKDTAAVIGALGTVATIIAKAAAAGTAATAVAAGAGAATGATSTVPIVGQVVAVVAAVIAFVAGACAFFLAPDRRSKSERLAGVNIYGGMDTSWDHGVEFTGWVQDRNTPGGCYYWQSIPIAGPKVDKFYDQVKDIVGAEWVKKGWEAFRALCKRYPWGPPVPYVSIANDGLYTYRYNVTGGPIDDLAGNVAHNIYWRDTKNLEDVRPHGEPVNQEPTQADLYAPWRATPLEPYIPKENGGEGRPFPGDGYSLSGTELENVQECVSPAAFQLLPVTTLGRMGGPSPACGRK